MAGTRCKRAQRRKKGSRMICLEERKGENREKQSGEKQTPMFVIYIHDICSIFESIFMEKMSSIYLPMCNDRAICRS